jgi:2-polyprenyl-3-methyl-5-hydroxy-6-metoxy-1,4-benzoquinol methylase
MHCPELGLFGKWPIDQRLSGLHQLLERSRGLSVVDFSSAEGLVAREFLKSGAARVHGFELDARRVTVANAVCAPWSGAEFRVADLSEWDTFQHSQAELIEDAYDVVLYLGIHHHLPVEHRLTTLRHAVGLARQYFAIRTTAAVYEMDRIDDLLRALGFHLLEAGTQAAQLDHLGAAMVYERRRAEGEPTR